MSLACHRSEEGEVAELAEVGTEVAKSWQKFSDILNHYQELKFSLRDWSQTYIWNISKSVIQS